MEVLYNVAAGIILSLGSSAVNEIGLWWGLKEELDKLRRTVGTIQAVLLHAEEQSSHNPAVKNWLGMLSEALYDAEDLLDEFAYEALHQQLMGGSDVSKKVCLFFSSSNQFVFGLKMGHKVKAVRKRLDEIAAEKNKFHLEERCGVVRSFVPKSRYQTHSSPPQVVIGREDDKAKIVQALLSSDCDENVSVVSIVGIGGLGKTTLAQMVFDDVDVKNHFELKMWVCVSDEFDSHSLVRKAIESASGENVDITEMDPLKNCLQSKINGIKYLLVLDDVWNEDFNKWCSFIDLLVGGARGSKIVITTRLRKVAEMSRPICTHELNGLSENESWSLFKQVAFKQERLPNPSLEAMGKEIVSKCCGVPLAIRTIGGMLYFKDLESEWLSLKDKEFSTIDVYKNDILPILKLSYNHLPSHYKHCFIYCSLYPKDFRIPVEEMIQLWRAQGFLKSTDQNECLRDVGMEYFKDFFRLSFFQDVEEDDFGNITYCRMHDLIHDLAVSVAGDNFSLSSHCEMKSINSNTRHISFWSNALPHVPSLLKAKRIRTILKWDRKQSCYYKKSEADAIFCNLRCLRVLNLSCIGAGALPNSIDKLKLLRYLDLSHSPNMKKLPNSVTTLQNLEVLKFERCGSLRKWPSNIKMLVNLTDLDNGICYKLKYMPRGIGKLTRLEKLSEYVIAKDNSILKHTGGLGELHSLNNLRGELKIKNLGYARNAASDFREAHLNDKKKLQQLTLYWSNSSCRAVDLANEETGMEALCPHPNLKSLEVGFYGGVKPPSWLPSITSLASVRFHNCRSLQRLPPFDQLPHLQSLYMSILPNLESIDVKSGEISSCFFPSLISLTLRDCPNLKGFKGRSREELPCFPRLSRLYMTGCPNLTNLPLFPELKRLDWEGMSSLMKVLKRPTNSAPTLSQLQFLLISNMEDCNEDEFDDGMCWQSLQVLRFVQFYGMENMAALPKGLQYAMTLRHLYISDCPSLESIPDWMPKLIELQHLIISFCSQLEERCNNNSAVDWPKISHIPNIRIGSRRIQRDGNYLL